MIILIETGHSVLYQTFLLYLCISNFSKPIEFSWELIKMQLSYLHPQRF